MADEKPLHVRVAEALGWTAYRSKHDYWIVTSPDGRRYEDGYGQPNPKYDSETGQRLQERQWWEEFEPPRYDTDWAATGPLIERFKIWLSPGDGCWVAWAQELDVDGHTPLLAVCKLILALSEAGKLPSGRPEERA